MARERNDHFMFEVINDHQSRTGKSLKVTKPSQVLRIGDVGELHAQLHHYNRPFLKLHVFPNSTFGRKFYVEKVRPALRYYCKKYDVAIPAWLKDDSYFHNLPEAEKLDMFGTTKLARREFKPIKAPPPDELPGDEA